MRKCLLIWGAIIMIDIDQIQQHLNKIYVSTDVYEHLANAGNINKDLFSNGCTIHGVDVIVKKVLPPKTFVHLNENVIKTYMEAVAHDIVLKSEKMEQLLEEVL